jgi:serine/threonine protein kinase/tetratricopeptide (TPR) repeat protein
MEAIANQRTCPTCGAGLDGGTAAGLCPRCLFAAALETTNGGSAAGSRDRSDPPAPSPAELAADFPELEIVELIGRGGMGAVYKARQPALDRWIALKILFPSPGSDAAFTERFSREAQAMGKLAHPGIVMIHGLGRTDEYPYLLLEYVEGTNLREALRAGMDPGRVLGVIREVCVALDYAHAQGLVHRDIKPENILLDARCAAKIADFGLAKIAGSDPGSLRLTRTRQVMGTPHYMAPEQVTAPLGVDHRADVYAVGVVLYEALTGHLPLGRFALPSQLSPADPRMDAVVSRALENDPERRYQRAGELGADLESILRSPAPRLASAARPSGRRLRRAALIGLAISALAAGGVAAHTTFKPPTSQPSPLPLPSPEQRSGGDYLPPVTTLAGQWGLVHAIAFDAEGRRVVGGSRDGSIKVWERDGAKVERSIVGHVGAVRSIALSDDNGTLVASTGEDVSVWDFGTGALKHTLKGHAGAAYGVATTPDGRRIVSGGAEGTMKIWNGEDGKLLRSVRHEGGKVLSVAISVDGRTAVSGGDSGAVRIWDAESGALRATIQAHTGPVNRLVISRDGQTLLTASDDHHAAAWLTSTGRNMQRFDGHYDEVWSVALSPDGSKVLTAGKDDIIHLWDKQRGTEIKRQPAKLRGVTDLAFSPDGQWFAASGVDGNIKLWRVPGSVWRPPVPPPDYAPPARPPLPPAASEAKDLTRRADALLERIDGRAGAAKEANALLDRALALDPNYALAHAIRARATYKSGYLGVDEYEPGSLPRALEHADRALALDPALERAHVIKGHVYELQKNYGEARKMVEAALRLQPGEPGAMLLQMELARREGHTQEALESARKLIESTTDPDVLNRVHEQLGDIYREMREWDAVEDTHVARTRLQPDSAWARGNYAAFLVWRGKYDAAVAMAESALQKMDYPAGRVALARAHAGKARQLVARKQLDLADEQIALARKAHPRVSEVEHAAALVLRGRAFAQKEPKLLDEAKQHLERALAIDPGNDAAKAALDEHAAQRDRLLRGQ